MSILNNKDSDRLETLRPYEASDPLYFSVLNRPLEDLNQRDDDNNNHFFPARGFRCRQVTIPVGSVEVESGIYWTSDTSTATTAVQTLVIPAATVGNIRIDFIYLNLATGVASRATGAEILAGGGFGAAVPAAIPANDGIIPLAYLYVDDGPTAFDELIPINTAGHIRDTRPALGTQLRLFENDASKFAPDGTAALGVRTRVPRSDHVHPSNVNNTNPATLGPSIAAAPGVSLVYPRLDHVHPVNTETDANAFMKDLPGGAPGTSVNFPRSDHQHALNVDAVVPATISRYTASTGAAAAYARRDHIHNLPTSLIQAITFFGTRADATTYSSITSTAINTGGLTVSANTFNRGIIVISQVEWEVINESSLLLELKMTQPAGLSKSPAGPGPFHTNRVATLAGDAGLTSLGFLPQIIGTATNDGENFDHEVNTMVFMWVSAVVSNIIGCGGGDWDPTKDTTVDWNRIYGHVGSNNFMYRRNIMVFGF